MIHYTDDSGHKGIAAQPDWRFNASKPPGANPVGAYFTTLTPDAPNLCARLRIPRRKIEYMFAFSGEDGLRPLDGDRGAYILWSPIDYVVGRATGRQTYNGRTEEL